MDCDLMMIRTPGTFLRIGRHGGIMNRQTRHVRRTLLLLAVMILSTTISAKAANLWLNKASVVLYAGYHTDLVLNGTKKKKVTWTSSNPAVATVSKTGTVTAVKKGTAIITATRKKQSFTCKITVKKNPYLKAVKKAKSRVAKPFTSYTSRPDRVLMYTGVPRTDYMLEVLVREIGITGDMTDEQILDKAYRYMSKYFYYLKDSHKQDPLPTYYDADKLSSRIKAFEKITDKAVEEGKIIYKKKLSNVVGTIESHMGVCNNHATVFSALCRHLGIKAGLAGGSYYGFGHTWSWAMLDGKKYYFDIGTSIHNFQRKSKKVTMSFFKMKKKKMTKKKHYHFSWEKK